MVNQRQKKDADVAFQVPGRYELERIVWKDVQILYLPWSKSLHMYTVPICIPLYTKIYSIYYTYTTYQYSLLRDISKSNAVDEGESENVCFKNRYRLTQALLDHY